MLEIILIASGAFLAALFCVWVYRFTKSVHDSKFRQVKLSGQRDSLDMMRDSGSVNLNVNPTRSGSARKPWGW